ncbi:MAG TPA: ABC transporter ATP-binding protein, partial [Clostridia bacterium]|nr:ABC transporter ATP-binding protein [Clostridia bacterium]
MKQRLGIAQALLHEPRLLICDEPTSALDPAGRKEVLDILSGLRERTTVLFSTHILSDAERICDRVAVLHKGRMVLDGPLEELKRHGRRDALDALFADAASCGRVLESPALAAYRAQAVADGRKLSLSAPSLEPLRAALFAACVQAGIYPERLETLEPSLENLFLEVVEVAG